MMQTASQGQLSGGNCELLLSAKISCSTRYRESTKEWNLAQARQLRPQRMRPAKFQLGIALNVLS